MRRALMRTPRRRPAPRGACSRGAGEEQAVHQRPDERLVRNSRLDPRSQIASRDPRRSSGPVRSVARTGTPGAPSPSTRTTTSTSPARPSRSGSRRPTAPCRACATTGPTGTPHESPGHFRLEAVRRRLPTAGIDLPGRRRIRRRDRIAIDASGRAIRQRKRVVRLWVLAARRLPARCRRRLGSARTGTKALTGV
jgi:hypothetical protein